MLNPRLPLTLYVAMADAHVIGRDNSLPWPHLPHDLPHFRQETMGKVLMMGRKTWDSLHGKPLPGRRNIVISRQDGLVLPGAEVFPNPIAAMTFLIEEGDDVAVIGGAAIYKACLPYATRMEVTRVQATCDGDVTFPDYDTAQWQEVARVPHGAGETYPPYDFITYVRV